MTHGEEESGASRAILAGIAFLIAIVALGTGVRVHTALTDENFDVESADGLLKSDPGLLYYLVERVLESGGAVPEDFRADPRLAHPALVDVPATYTVGQEFLVAWTYRLFGEGLPLHVFCVWVMGLCASLVAVGVFGLAWELTRSVRWASFAAFLYAVLPASYRTVGFILIREDLSLPFFAVHLWLLARAARVRSTPAFLAAGLALGLALATWHATGFLVALEALVLLAWFLWTAENPFTCRRAWSVPAVALVFTLVVPALRAKLAFFSLPMLIAGALLFSARMGRGSAPWQRRGFAFAALALLAALSAIASEYAGGVVGGREDFSHVYRLMWAKLRLLGQLPSDPADLAFDARLLWQGPFATWPLAHAWHALRVALVLAVPAMALGAWQWVRGKDRELALLAGLATLGLVAAWLVQRVFVLPGILLPVLAAVTVHRVAARLAGRVECQGATFALGAVLVGALAWQMVAFAGWARDTNLAWYRPAVRQAELATLVRALPDLVPEDEAVAADFMTSTAILAHARRPIVLQPKWETKASRLRVERFLRAFFEGSPDELRDLLTTEYDCRYVLFDRATLRACSYTAGLRGGAAPKPGTAAAIFLSQDDVVLASVPGYELLWRSPRALLQSNGRPSDFFRLYALEE